MGQAYGELLSERATEAGLASSWWAVQEDDAVEADDVKVDIGVREEDGRVYVLYSSVNADRVKCGEKIAYVE